MTYNNLNLINNFITVIYNSNYMQQSFKPIIFSLFFLIFTFGQIDAQVVISSATPQPEDGSAVLELQSPDMGLLIPKFDIDDLTDPSPVTSPAVGLLVYNTSSITPKGFYFWDGVEWTEVINDKRVFANEQFGELYEISATSPTLIELVSNASWYGWVSATQGILSAGITSDTINAIADRMNISRYGLYKIEVCLSIGGTQNQQITSALYIVRSGSDIETRITTFSKISSAGDIISASSMGVLELYPGDAIDLRFKSTNNNEDLYIYTINLIITKVGE